MASRHSVCVEHQGPLAALVLAPPPSALPQQQDQHAPLLLPGPLASLAEDACQEPLASLAEDACHEPLRALAVDGCHEPLRALAMAASGPLPPKLEEKASAAVYPLLICTSALGNNSAMLPGASSLRKICTTARADQPSAAYSDI